MVSNPIVLNSAISAFLVSQRRRGWWYQAEICWNSLCNLLFKTSGFALLLAIWKSAGLRRFCIGFTFQTQRFHRRLDVETVPETVWWSPVLCKVNLKYIHLTAVETFHSKKKTTKNQHYTGTRGKVRPGWTLTFNHLWYNNTDLIAGADSCLEGLAWRS